jgi:thiol-disulfide isomerase/thioredoxin
MLRRLLPVCLSLALWGCSASAPPPSDTAASAPGGSSRPAERRASQAGESNSAGNTADADGQPAAGARDEAATSGAAARAAGRNGEPKTSEADASPKAADGGGVETAMMKFRRARTPKARQRAAADLEKALAAEPDHVEGLLFMVQALLAMSADAEDEDEPTEALHHKSVAYLEMALQGDPEVRDIRGFKGLAAAVYFEDASALAREKKEADSVARLKTAVEHGLPLEALDYGDDLEAVRKLPEFSAFVAEAREKIKQEISQLLEENRPFDFNFDLEDIAGNKLSKADLKGKVLIVDFWGTWCPPCKREIPHFVALDKEFRSQGLQIVGLNSEQEDDAEAAAKLVRQFTEKAGIRYPCALVNDELIEQVPGLEGFPTTLFVDRTGTVRLKAAGYHDLFFLRTVVETLLSETPAEADGKPADKKDE